MIRNNKNVPCKQRKLRTREICSLSHSYYINVYLHKTDGQAVLELEGRPLSGLIIFPTQSRTLILIFPRHLIKQLRRAATVNFVHTCARRLCYPMQLLQRDWVTVRKVAVQSLTVPSGRCRADNSLIGVCVVVYDAERLCSFGQTSEEGGVEVVAGGKVFDRLTAGHIRLLDACYDFDEAL